MKKYIPTIALLGLYTFFYLVLELAINDYAEPVIGAGATTTLYGVSYMVVATGYLLYYIAGRALQGRTALHRTAAVSAAVLGVAAFLIISFTASPMLLVACALVSHLTSGYIGGAVYYYVAMKLKDSGRIGLSLGIAYAGANAVQAAALVMLSFISIPVGRWIERVALVLALVVLGWVLVARLAPAPQQPSVKAHKTPANIHKYILGALAAMALIAIMQGLNDGIASALHAASEGYGEGYIVYGFPRLLAIPGLLVAGAVADVRDRRLFPYATLLSMIIMTTAILLFSAPATYNIATCFLYFSGTFASLYSAVPFIQWAPFTEKPALTAAAGRSVRYGFSGLAIIVSGVLFASASLTALLIVYVVFLALLFTAFFFMGQLHLPPRKKDEAAATFQAFAQAHALTEREAEILAMLSGGSSTAEVAGALFISDKTVRNHISNMLMKTGSASRTELLVLARQAQLEGQLP